MRLLFLLYLILPQTQGARLIYEEHVHPFLEENEGHIDEFIASSHERLKAAGITYVKQAIEFLKTNILGQPPSDPTPPTPPAAGPQSYTSALLARFSVPAARWATPANSGADFYNLLAGAVSAVAGANAGAGARSGGSDAPGPGLLGTLIPSNLQSSSEKMTFIDAQRQRLNILLSALEREAQQIETDKARDASAHAQHRAPSMAYDGAGEEDETTQRPPSGLSMWSGLSKSRSEADFEKIDAESGGEEESSIRRRNASNNSGGGGSWMPWAWGAGASSGGDDADRGYSTGAEKQD